MGADVSALSRLLCDWTHAGGHITRDAQGRINWQCSTCGRWSTPVSPKEERQVVDRELENYRATLAKIAQGDQ